MNDFSDNINQPTDNDDDSSGYLTAEATQHDLDLGGLFSDRFANITPLHSSPGSPFELFTATRYGKRFVLKCLKPQYRQDPIHTLGLAKEFEIGISFDHPNIRRTIGLETVEGYGKAIVLEYIDGYSLEDLIAGGRISSQMAKTIIAQIAAGLGYIHSKQVLHRDIKLSNILVAHQSNVVKLIDFNLSDSETFIILKNPAGTRKYIAPEMLMPEARPTVTADIYSFGVVIDELAQCTNDQQLAEIAKRCQAIDPEDRPQSVEEIRLMTAQSSIAKTFSNFLSSKWLTFILSLICAALVTIIVRQLLIN